MSSLGGADSRIVRIESQPDLTASNVFNFFDPEAVHANNLLNERLGSKIDIETGAVDGEGSIVEDRSSPEQQMGEEATPEPTEAVTPSLPIEESPPYFSNYDFHYDREFTEITGLRQILEDIVQDLASQHDIHDWDKTQTIDPMKKLLAFLNRELDSMRFGRGSHIARVASVEEICTIIGQNKSEDIHRDPTDERRGFFPNKDYTLQAADQSDVVEHLVPELGYGHIIHMSELIPESQRLSLLLLHTFCARLQMEDFTFLRKFIQRHLGMKYSLQVPGRLQDTSPSNIRTKCYERVTLSIHLPHLLLETGTWSDGPSKSIPVDREYIGNLGAGRSAEGNATTNTLYRSTSSVLLTIAKPKIQAMHEEALSLLGKPDALWTVLLVNGPSSTYCPIQQDLLEESNPLAQFLRGVCGALAVQKAHAEAILESLKTQLTECIGYGTFGNSETAHLFDDKLFTKSKLYHSIIKTCHLICDSVDTALGFVTKFENSDLRMLQRRMHSNDASSLELWTSRLSSEKAELDMLKGEVHGFREQTRELRDALHGATAILESRAAILQGQRIQTLTYLSSAFLPLATVSSFYGMNVLPRQATFQSFFAVTAVIAVITAILIFFLRDMVAVAKKFPQCVASSCSYVWHYQYIAEWRAFDSRLYYGYADSLTAYENWLDGFESYQFRFVYPQQQLLYFLRKLQRPMISFGSEPLKFSVRLFCYDILQIFSIPLFFALAILLWILWSLWTFLAFLKVLFARLRSFVCKVCRFGRQ